MLVREYRKISWTSRKSPDRPTCLPRIRNSEQPDQPVALSARLQLVVTQAGLDTVTGSNKPSKDQPRHPSQCRVVSDPGYKQACHGEKPDPKSLGLGKSARERRFQSEIGIKLRKTEPIIRPDQPKVTPTRAPVTPLPPLPVLLFLRVRGCSWPLVTGV